MQTLKIDSAKKELKKNLDKVFKEISSLSLQINLTLKEKNLEEKIKILKNLRSKIYENLNIYQHEALLIKSCEYFSGNNLDNVFYNVDEWKWHPHQTSATKEVDLMGYKNDKLVICAEVTTASLPKGKIDKVMKRTLEGLDKLTFDNLPEAKYYIVVSDEMQKRAETKIKKNQSNIKVLNLQ
jgi:hypothetical protein